jgi:hypothetical protein
MNANTNWANWIKKRFEDTNKYRIIDNRKECEIIIKSSDRKITTEIHFVFMTEEDEEVLYDIQFNGGPDDTKYTTWVSHFTIDPMYEPTAKERRDAKGFLHTSLFLTQEFVDRMEQEWLLIPLKKGWNEEVHFVGDKIISSKMKTHPSSSTQWDKKEHNYWSLSFLDVVKIIFRIGTRIEKSICKAIEK